MALGSFQEDFLELDLVMPTAFLQLIFPFGGYSISVSGGLPEESPVKWVMFLATNLGFKLFTYLPIALIYLFLSLYLVEKKGGKLWCLIYQ